MEAFTTNRVEFYQQQARTTLDRLMPARYRDATCLPRVATWVQQVIDNPAEAGALLLAGPTGVGKTRQGWAAVRDIVLGRAARGQGTIWRVTTHPDLVTAARPHADGSHVGRLERDTEADLLLLDDIGAVKPTEWVEELLYRLVDHRWRLGLPTLYSTNLGADQVVGMLGARVESRIQDATRIVLDDQPDHRKDRP